MQEVVQNRKIERKGFEEAPTLYANSVDILISVYDFQLLLGQIEEATEERLTIRAVAKVAMSPQHAKALANVLAENVSKYEEMFGPLPSAPGGRPSR
jgi:flagellar protein FlaG